MKTEVKLIIIYQRQLNIIVGDDMAMPKELMTTMISDHMFDNGSCKDSMAKPGNSEEIRANDEIKAL